MAGDETGTVSLTVTPVNETPTLDAIATTKTSRGDRPETDVVMKSVTITEA